MQWSGQRGNRARDRGVHTGERAGHHAGRKRRRVQFVIGMQNQANIEYARVMLGRHLALEQVEKVRGDVVLGAGL